MDRSPLHLLHRASQVCELLFWREAPGSVTPRQLAVLIAVAETEGLSQTDVSERTRIDRMTTADVIRRMIRQGLVQRRRSRLDRRAYAVNLTDQGRKLLAAAEPVARSVDSRLLQPLLPERRELFLEALRTVAHALDER